MDLTRRDLLKLLLASVAAEAVDVEKLLWIPKPIITVPSLPDWMCGIPYHQSNASTGTWLGIERSTTPWPWKAILRNVCIDTTKPLLISKDGKVSQ